MRTTSEKFAHYCNDKSVFSFDWIVFKYVFSSCDIKHLNQIIEINLDQQDEVSKAEWESLKVKIQHALTKCSTANFLLDDRIWKSRLNSANNQLTTD